MTAAHPQTPVPFMPPAPRRGDDPTPVVRHAEDFLGAAEAMAGAARCASAVDCGRPGTFTVVTDDATFMLCGMHAMTAVFTTPGRLALAKPAEL